MIHTGLLLGKIIPIDILMQMPRPFVHRLRDIRIKMLEDANKEREQQTKQNSNNAGIPQMPVWDAGMQTGTELDDFMDELNPI